MEGEGQSALSDILLVAAHLLEQHGRSALALVETLAREHDAMGDGEGAAFWSRVGRAVHALQSGLEAGSADMRTAS